MLNTEIIDIKIILIGESGTGKSNLVNICCNLKFNNNTASNISSSILEKRVEIDKIPYNLKFWDTAGQEKFRSLNNIFIKESRICIFTYDVSRPETFEALLNYWVKSSEEILGKEVIFGLVANKIDLEEKVKKEEGEKFAEEIGAMFFQTSAKNDQGEFSEFVDKLVKEFLNKSCLYGWEIIEKEERISLTSNFHVKTKNKNFC